MAMTYDANGNLLTRTGNGETWSLCWTGFDKPRWMAKEWPVTAPGGGTQTYLRGNAFVYGPDHERIMNLEYDSVAKANANDPTTWTPLHLTGKKVYVGGGTLELEYGNTVTTTSNGTPNWTLKKARVYIPSPAGNVGTAELAPAATSAAEHKYLVYHYDELGSVQAITAWGETSADANFLFANDATGKESLYSYSPWGERRDAKDWLGYSWNGSSTAPAFTWGRDDPSTTGTTQNEEDLIPRGFTGHEMLDNLGLIHMNGRIYDARLGRFLSADQVVQAPASLQSYNRYSYCFNNPLGYVDPSGYEATGSFVPDDHPAPPSGSWPRCIVHDYTTGIDMPGYMPDWSWEFLHPGESRPSYLDYRKNMSDSRPPHPSSEASSCAVVWAADEAAPASPDENNTDAESITPPADKCDSVDSTQPAPNDDKVADNQTPSATLEISDKGPRMPSISPDGKLGLAYLNEMEFTVKISGSDGSNIQISQVTHLQTVDYAGVVSVGGVKVENEGKPIYDGTSLCSTFGGGFGCTSSGEPRAPDPVKTDPDQMTALYHFYDAPGIVISDARAQTPANYTINATTVVGDKRTGAILCQRSWLLTIHVDRNGNMSSNLTVCKQR